MIKEFLAKSLLIAANGLASWSFRFKRPTEPRVMYPDYDNPNLGNSVPLPPLSTAEEAELLARMLSTITIRKQAIVPISRTGQVPKSIQQIFLTEKGLVTEITECRVQDDFGRIGTLDEVAGLCQVCEQKFSFASKPCEGCGRSTCPACGSADPTGSHFLCKPCAKKANWSKNNWALTPIIKRNAKQ